MKRGLPMLLLILAILSLYSITTFAQTTKSVYQPKNNGKVAWMSLEEAIEKNKENPKKVLVDLYTPWCTWCMKMDKATFNNPAIATYINENFYPVKLDAETKRPIQFKGETYNFDPKAANNRRGVHQIAIWLTRSKLNYPSVVILDESMGNPQVIHGFKNPVEMDKFIKFFGEDFYTEMDWNLFIQLYESPLERNTRMAESTGKRVAPAAANNRYTAPAPTPKPASSKTSSTKASPALTIAKQKALAKAIDSILYEVY